MKLLIYGGCHALIIKRLIDELGPPGRHTVDVLINFELVARGLPFPYEILPNYDVVLYSPVENKGEYNTCHLDDACVEAGVPPIRFPWLEWHGHAPGADKDGFWGHHGWYFPGLIDLARRHSDLDAFVREARETFPSDETIREVFAYSTRRLVDQETRIGCEVRISDFILDRFCEQRMFHIPDHPTLTLYRHVLCQLERLLGERLIASWPADLPEPQPEEITPILPRVAAVTGLAPALTDETWRCSTQPIRAMDLEGYLAMHFFRARCDEPGAAWDAERQRGLTVATALRSSWVVGERSQPEAPGPVETGIFDQLLVRREGPADARGLFAAEVLAPLGTIVPSGRLTGRRLFRGEDWRCRS